MTGQLAGKSIDEYHQRFLAQLALIEVEVQRQAAAEAARLQAEAEAAAEKQWLQAKADADTQARRKEGQDLLQRHEAASVERLKFWHFEPAEDNDKATPEEQHKEFLSKLVTRLVYTCNHLQSELEKQHQELANQHQELANLRQTVQNHKDLHKDATRALHSRVQDLEQVAPRPDVGESRSAPSTRQLEERVDHVVAMLGDISTFAAPATISEQLDTLQTELRQLHQPPDNDRSTSKHDKMPTFGIEKSDDYTHQDPVVWWDCFTTELGIHEVPEYLFISALFLNIKGGCQIWLSHMATIYGVQVNHPYKKISSEDLMREWKKWFIVDDAPTLAINRLFTMTQGNTPTRDWLTKWQKIVATPDLELPFSHLRREFYNRSCAALSLALGDREQYMTLPKLSTRRGRSSRPTGLLHTRSQRGSQPMWRKENLVHVRSMSLQSNQTTLWKTRQPPQHHVREIRWPLSSCEATTTPVEKGTQKPHRQLETDSQYHGSSLTSLRPNTSGTAGMVAAIGATAPSTRPPNARIKARRTFNLDSARATKLRRSEAVSFDILDTQLDVILGMSWLRSEDHPVNFYHCTVHVRDRNGVLVPCTVPPPHPSISCHVVSAASIRASITRDDIKEMGGCFLHVLPPHDIPSTDSSPDHRIIELLDAYGDVFEVSHGVVPDWPIRHEIILEAGAVPPRGCIYRMSEEELSVLRAQLDDLLEKGWIRPSSSPYGAPVLFVWKKNKDLRLCIDYRKLNAQTVKNAGPLPLIDDLLERLGGAKFFSKLDLKSGYHQLEIRQEDRYKTAFKTRYGHFEWLVMPFGLTNAPATFQVTMTTEFRHMLYRFVLIYLDDVLVYSRSLDDHVEHLRTVFERLRQAKYKANHDKCEFARQEMEYLGHYVTPQGIRLLADKIEAIRVWPEPTNTTDVRSFMGLAGYYQRFITGYSRITAPLTRLQLPKVPLVFDDDERRSFQALKTTMLMAPVLSIYDPILPTRVTTDASSYGIGAVLEQQDGDNWHPLEYFSHKVPPINSLDDARKKELLAFVMTLKRWRHFLLGRYRFTWVTDNNPLTYYRMQDTVRSTIRGDQFDFTSKHLSGLSNRAADALSRNPIFAL
ncbi:hypothetical protein CBR_g50395 [Chara braunii]|uniref:Reverse transcriptase domain-containing protein n=1 Tax=Chara braunii TaxID=69332 RepID=A0A388M6R1_CHABU|nr:hypothetical protein CBR_g50395 [Chara braunii]|eukprot:GBG90216.1 hypothetical protein CBR_g50395 [Chara braunii]